VGFIVSIPYHIFSLLSNKGHKNEGTLQACGILDFNVDHYI